MLHRIKHFYGNHLQTLDNDRVGHVADCYFDDRTWAVRYFAVDTDWWTRPRRVLLSPHAFGPIPAHGHILPVNLTRQQIETGPTLDLNEAVTRQHEEDYYRHYNWPFYWLGGSLWGPSDFPGGSPSSAPPCQSNVNAPASVPRDSHLRSAREFFGFPIHSGSETVGSVGNLLMEEKDWRIPFLVVVHRRYWFPSRTILLSTRRLLPVDWEGERVLVTCRKEDIERAFARHDLAVA